VSTRSELAIDGDDKLLVSGNYSAEMHIMPFSCFDSSNFEDKG
jgi:hypothetical protein